MAHPRSRLAIAASALTLAALSGATILTAGEVATAAAAPATAPATATAPAPATATAEATLPAPTFAEVSVHDPSVVTSGEDIWVFGSHGASAHTTDLMNWTQHTVDLGISRDNALFEDIDTELAETFAWAETTTLWASDAIQLEDGRYYLYYNACRGDSPRSALGVAVSDSVNGPYEDLGIMLRSGQRDGEPQQVPGEDYDATVNPNAVDPDVFFDADGRLWMVYGSYSGGIFILELDPATGMPLPNQEWGTHLIGGNHARIEAPTIRFDEQTGYYYLFVSFGGLTADGGYDMRVMRSENPDGPYVDAQGHDMSSVMGGEGTLFDDAAIEPHGVKLMGGHQWTRAVGDPGSGTPLGYVSPGHNSWYDDPITGESFLVFHSRFPGTGERHEVRVQQMWMTEDGWPVLSPMRYAGESAGAVASESIAGGWQLVDLGKDITADPAPTSRVTLAPDGTITGETEGTWTLTGDNTMTVSLDGIDYTGFAVPIWDADLDSWSTGLTLRDATGASVLGRALDTPTGQDAVDATLAALTLGSTTAVTADLSLPLEGTGGTVITWVTSDDAVVTAAGAVTRPPVGAPDATVTLTATAVNGEATGSKDFEVTVLATTEAAGEAAWSFDGDLTESTGTYAPATTTGNRLTTTGGTASYVDDGVVGSALRLDGESGVRLPDGLIRTHQYSVSLWLRPAALTQFTTAFFGGPTTTRWISLNPRGWSDTTMLWSGEAWYDAVSPTLIPTGEWTHVAFTVDEGAVTLYLDGEPAFAGTGFPDVFTTDDAVFGLGVNHWDVPYEGDIDELGVWSRSLTPTEIADLANPVGPEPSFIDVEGSEHAVAIGWLAAEGISTGWSTAAGQEFRPLAQIKRDAMAAFLYRYAGSPEVTLPAESPFVDVTPDSTEFYEEIVWMFQEGISTGWETSEGREFRPLAPVKRDAMAAFLYRYAGEPAWADPGESPFVDVTASSTEFFTEITWLESTGITTGWSTPAGQEYRPLSYTKRDAMATFLYRFDQLDS